MKKKENRTREQPPRPDWNTSSPTRAARTGSPRLRGAHGTSPQAASNTMVTAVYLLNVVLKKKVVQDNSLCKNVPFFPIKNPNLKCQVIFPSCKTFYVVLK